MPTNLLKVQKQIADLKALEERLKREEAAGVAARIREAIVAYGFTVADLFGSTNAKPAPLQAIKPFSKFNSKLSQKALYADGNGNEWVGRGPRPAWLRAAITDGKSLADFAVGRSLVIGRKPNAMTTGPVSHAEAQSPTESLPDAPKKRAIKYRDGEGNSWSGGGSQPRWLRAALESGKALEDFRA